MNNIYLYADEHSVRELLSEKQKIISIGGDFGHGNFGDILQNIGSLNLSKKSGKFSAVSVMGASAIGFKEFPEWARGVYGADALIFISDYPLILDAQSPALNLVGEIKNVAAVQMYGGGFLNEMWGIGVLNVVEYFLQLAPNANYFVSGQQITSPFHERLLQHIKTFKPSLFGVRDEISGKLLEDIGFTPQFSFDDATELLCRTAQKLGVQKSPGVLMHLNTSPYTKNDSDLSRMGEELRLISERMGEGAGITLLQAFNDNRPEVIDSRESLKIIGRQFPFNDFREVDLTAFAYGAAGTTSRKMLSGEFGYSCSYHVALFLQLSGIPCWLRSSNTFYDQKSQALQVNQDLVSFLEDPCLADHRLNLERRALWLERFEKAIADTPEVHHVSRVPVNDDGPAPWPFFFKGRPSLEEKLKVAEQAASEAKNQLQAQTDAHVQSKSSLEDRLKISQHEINEMGQRMAHLTEQWKVAEHAAEQRIQQLQQQVDTYREQLTVVGSEIHLQRDRMEHALLARHVPGDPQAASRLADAHAHSRQLTEQIEQLLRSRSWRLSRPLRAIARYVKHGHFDSQGQVGLYGLAQRLGRRLPISSQMRARIGRLLSKFRRQGKK